MKVKISSRGINGTTTFSIYLDDEPVITGKGVSDFSKEIMETYPELAKDMHKSFELDGEAPSNISFTGVEPGKKFELLEAVSNVYKINNNK